ncbi:hypothetical protein AB0425_16870 [Actinosynnema sp. NPDC051121]
MDESELGLVVQVERTPVVQNRTELQASDGAVGDSGETRDP